ncbi:uncharacterized protein LOC143569943 [Bidens hawaiensis]|uniref:uncharacterized protein LOC143569943 n=1 Tax=Bidens hawaiensis TaxID=980011 RepID=UPI0040499B98
MIRVAIGGKSKCLLNHLTEKPPDPMDDQWEQDDLVVFSWLIQNIEPSLASNLTEFPTSKALWDALVITYSSGKDKLQTFDLHVKANEIKQNGAPLEDIWIIMQGIWGEIERRDPNPMTCATDITTYNNIRAEQKLFQFLNALDRQYDPIKREILRWEPLPSAEGSSLRVDKNSLKCSHCGMSKHTKEQCFKLVGFPEWWNDGHKKGNKDEGKTVATASGSKTTGSGGGNQSNSSDRSNGFGGMASADVSGDCDLGHTSDGGESRTNKQTLEPIGQVNMAKICDNLDKQWIFDCGATDTITFKLSDIVSISQPKINHIKTANGGIVPVKGGGTIEISPTLKLSNCLYVPSLSHKLLSDIKTGVIIGRGTERQGLYYVEEVTQHGTWPGEKVNNDTLSWLKYVPKWASSSEEVNHSIQDESQASQQSSGPTLSVPNQNRPDLTFEVSNSHEDNNDIFNNHETTIEQAVQEEQGDPMQKTTVQEEQDELIQEATIEEETTERYVLPPRVNRGIPPKRYSPIANIAEGNLSKEAQAFNSSLYAEQIPTSLEQALKSKNWKDAMDAEMKALMKNDTWEKCDLPSGKKPVGCRWVFTIKHKPDGTIERYTARLVAKGYPKRMGLTTLRRSLR